MHRRKIGPFAQGTIDEMMYEMLQKKKRVINTVVGDEQEDFDISESFFKQLMVRR